MTRPPLFHLCPTNEQAATPLQASWRLLEASAGTGKTYTLAGLFVRMLLEIPEANCQNLLVITFTRAATAELRERIQRLIHACLTHLEQANPKETDPFILYIGNTYQGQAAAIARLRRSYLEMDQAKIQTIDSFCQSILQQYALSSGRALDLEISHEHEQLDQEIAADFWRQHLAPLNKRSCSFILANDAVSIEQLGKLGALALQHNQFRISNANISSSSIQEHFQSIESLITQANAAWPSCKSALFTIHEQGCFKGNTNFKPANFESLITDLESLLADDINGQFDILRYFNPSKVSKAIKKEYKDFDDSSQFLDLAEKLYTALLTVTDLIHAEFLQFYQEHIDERLEQSLQCSHQDNVRWLDQALIQNPKLAHTVGNDFLGAFIDECQDTDDKQHRIFKALFHLPKHHVYLIGDPKQSIYRFRGADIYSYLHAKNQVTETYLLGCNYRSDQSVVAGCNELFQQIEAPFLLPEITYHSVSAHEQDRLSIGQDSASGLVCWDIHADLHHSALSIAHEIKYLQQDARLNETESITYSDFAILVKSHAKGEIIASTLEQQGIPVVRSGGQNVFNSLEAYSLLDLLRACLNRHQNRAVATALARPLCAFTDQELIAESAEQFKHARKNLHTLLSIWQEHGILAMFQYFLAHGCKAASEDVRQRFLQSQHGERSIVNLQHVVELLHQHAIETQAGPIQTLHYFEQCCSDQGTQKEEQELRLSTDNDAVTIMTIHRSKGLEFPIVFIPDVLKKPALNSQKHRVSDCNVDGKLQLVYNNDVHTEYKSQLQREALAESFRLFYVAVTRAKHRCYIAVGNDKNTCMAALNEDPSQAYTTYQTMAKDPNSALSWKHIPTTTITNTIQEVEDKHYTAPQALSIQRAWSFSSYSGIIRQLEHSAHDYDAHVSSSDIVVDFPKGPSAGNCLHKMFEELPFDQAFDITVTDPIIEEQLRSAHYESHYVAAARRIVQRTLSTRLPQLPLCLQDIPSKHRIAELEFTATQDHVSSGQLADCLLAYGNPQHREYFKRLASIYIQPGFLRGFIDLLFYHDQAWHVLDWKSNALAVYDYEHMYHEMSHHDYIFQYHIYTLALHRLLALRMPNYDYDQHIGNVYYAFIRGIQPDTPELGWFVDRPSKKCIESLDALLQGAAT